MSANLAVSPIQSSSPHNRVGENTRGVIHSVRRTAIITDSLEMMCELHSADYDINFTKRSNLSKHSKRHRVLVVDIDNGMTDIPNIRAANQFAIIIGVTGKPFGGKAGSALRTEFLNLGGDYVAPKYSCEIFAAVRANVRLIDNAYPTLVLCGGNAIIDLRAEKITVGKKPLHVPRKQKKILMMCANHPNTLITMDELKYELYGYTDDNKSNTICACLSILRSSLNKALPGLGACIKTVGKRGYMFDPSV